MPLKFLINFLLDAIYPPFCTQCHRLGTFLCDHCYEQITFYVSPIKLTLEPLYLDGLHAAAEYEQPISSLIQMMKYQHVKDIGKYLGELLYYTSEIPMVDAVTAVPLHRERQTERGFNQAEEIAQRLAQLMNVPYVPLLSRTHQTLTQASLTSRSQRLQNLNTTFVTRGHAPLPLSVLLIDDVVTTGTTLNQCAKVLKAAGVKQVFGLTVAHGN